MKTMGIPYINAEIGNRRKIFTLLGLAARTIRLIANKEIVR
jgi:hypothetical protein